MDAWWYTSRFVILGSENILLIALDKILFNL